MKELFVSRPPQDNVVDCSSIEESLRILQLFTSHGDPLMTLQHYYQRRGYLKSLSDCWLPPVWYREGTGKESHTYWRCAFKCPLQNTMASSTIAAALLQPEQQQQQQQQENPLLEQLSHLSTQWFGNFLVSPKDGLVYFSTKKNAKRSAGLLLLYRLFGKDGIPDDQMQQSKKNAYFQSPTKTTNIISDPKALNKKLQKLSKVTWIHPLHAAGIRKLRMRYVAICDDSTVLSPTKVICELEVRHPASIHVKSDPMPTKAQARDHAIIKLLEQLPPPTLVKATDTDTLIEANEKEQLLLCDSSYINCRFELPHWAQWNASCRSSTEALLYQVILSSSSSDTQVIAERFGIDSKDSTRIGLLLPLCEEFSKYETIFTFEAPFQFQTTGPIHKVQLSHPQRIQLDDVQSLLEDFHTICSQWKVYGQGSPMDTLKSRVGNGRHYTFVPMRDDDQIDWDLIKSVVSNHTTPYLVATRRHDLPLLWTCLLMIIGYICLPYVWQEGFTNKNLVWVTPLIFLAVFGLLQFFHPRYIYDMNNAALSNHFLWIDNKPNLPFIATNNPITSLTARSLFPEHKAVSQPDSSTSNIRFLDMIRKHYKIRLRHTNVNLLRGYTATKISNFNRLEVEMPNNAIKMFLMPELVRILPMPQDFLFAIGSADKYMMPLETIINQHTKAQNLKQVAWHVGSEVLCKNSSSTDPIAPGPSFVNNLTEATTVFPVSRFERLEFLGDRVLNHMISLNMLTRNGELQWSYDDYIEHCSIAKTNAALTDGALRAGLDRIMHAGVIPWKDVEATFVIPDAFFSCVAESILGAVYLEEWNGMSNSVVGRMTVGILERLNLPMPQHQSELSKSWWARCGSVFLQDGFNFDDHPLWCDRLKETEHAFEKFPALNEALQVKSERLLSILLRSVPESDRADLQVRLERRTPKLLSLIALFDASLDGSDPLLEGKEDQERLEVAGMLRDSLFHIGSTALELELSRDFYLLNPNATPGDLHLLLTCALTHDVVAYIFLKSGFDQCMFDENPLYRDEIIQKISAADTIGEIRWEANDGWILPGGLHTFNQRLQKFERLQSDFKSLFAYAPRYPGLAAGRFCGTKEKSNFSTIDDWQFSFKCIVGYLVLAIGTDETCHNLLRPFLLEVMLLTPEDYRENFKDVSTICESYARGNTNCVGR